MDFDCMTADLELAHRPSRHRIEIALRHFAPSVPTEIRADGFTSHRRRLEGRSGRDRGPRIGAPPSDAVLSDESGGRGAATR